MHILIDLHKYIHRVLESSNSVVLLGICIHDLKVSVFVLGLPLAPLMYKRRCWGFNVSPKSSCAGNLILNAKVLEGGA